MKTYKKIDVSEQQLEDLVRRYTDEIEEGLVYVDHQKQTVGGRLDVLMVDSGNALVIAELKIVQEDGMLMQGLDYYDYISCHIEAFARLYESHKIDPKQQVRLFLIAPSFSQTLINRCRWLDLPISLFTFNCLLFEDDVDLVPIFSEQELPTRPTTIELSSIDDHLMYITDSEVRNSVKKLLEEVQGWKQETITLDATQSVISMKINGRVFAYLGVRRKHYRIATYNDQDEWTKYPINNAEDLIRVKPIVRNAMERKMIR